MSISGACQPSCGDACLGPTPTYRGHPASHFLYTYGIVATPLQSMAGTVSHTTGFAKCFFT